MSSYFIVKTALTQEQVKQAQTEADQTFPFSCACSCACFNIFSWKWNMKLKTKECSWAVFFINHSFWVRSWFYQDHEDCRGRRKFEESVSETMCLFPGFIFMMVPFSLDTRSLCLFLRLFNIPCPHWNFMATSDFFWCQFFPFFVARTGLFSRNKLFCLIW